MVLEKNKVIRGATGNTTPETPINNRRRNFGHLFHDAHRVPHLFTVWSVNCAVTCEEKWVATLSMSNSYNFLAHACARWTWTCMVAPEHESRIVRRCAWCIIVSGRADHSHDKQTRVEINRRSSDVARSPGALVGVTSMMVSAAHFFSNCSLLRSVYVVFAPRSWFPTWNRACRTAPLGVHSIV